MIAFTLHHPFKGTALLGVFLAGLLGLCVFQLNTLTASVYSLGDQEERLDELKAQGLLLQAQHLPNLSRARMEQLAHAMQLERVQKVSYLRVLGGAVAQNTGKE
ncbi:MAG: hypothetical protein A3D64_03150 [Candidatus Wildermuthbacteria bacterium RIFCSPHIGHO2_02_FULL_49_9]|uniref:Uncharacterized protein n=1 Tax=Candidatus Wildermuthbacteria bacterium RIFCSPHIGHO2_02_FULL_49_9 TaxID=1802456 RepID=A0A1G2REE0_9BACT|nr:MAG: hypothetical protein A3D64_03150 [Candidatus Wildermuthbacteria bacterium RIFCSPHIGHO2_02_FULL_49_9]